MGMFDEYILKEPVHCPECYEKIEILQSKEGECYLFKYKEGIPYEEFERLRYIDAYSSCKNKHFVYIRLDVDEHGAFHASDKVWVWHSESKEKDK